mmetsp:Transcript_33891/g.107652  ORF Transcript_33891/g.107652 Transcript_33891/m.107652 type:complete len:289 (-) Transcript_33891:256-1122(-)
MIQVLGGRLGVLLCARPPRPRVLGDVAERGHGGRRRALPPPTRAPLAFRHPRRRPECARGRDPPRGPAPQAVAPDAPARGLREGFARGSGRSRVDIGDETFQGGRCAPPQQVVREARAAVVYEGHRLGSRGEGREGVLSRQQDLWSGGRRPEASSVLGVHGAGLPQRAHRCAEVIMLVLRELYEKRLHLALALDRHFAARDHPDAFGQPVLEKRAEGLLGALHPVGLARALHAARGVYGIPKKAVAGVEVANNARHHRARVEARADVDVPERWLPALDFDRLRRIDGG